MKLIQKKNLEKELTLTKRLKKPKNQILNFRIILMMKNKRNKNQIKMKNKRDKKKIKLKILNNK